MVVATGTAYGREGVSGTWGCDNHRAVLLWVK